MADHTKLQTILGAGLQVARMPEALLVHFIEATNANYARRLLGKTNGFVLTDNEEAAAYGAAIALLDSSMGPAVRSLFSTWRDSYVESRDGFFTWLASEIVPSKADEESILDWDFDETDGVVTVVNRKGMWGAFYNRMFTDRRIILANAITVSVALAALTTNRGGALTGTTLVFRSNALSGTYTFECVNESVTQPEFRVTVKLSKALPDGTVINVEASKNLRCEKAFTDPKTGLEGVVLTRAGLAAPTISGDHATTPLFSLVSVTTPFESDCTKGVFFTRISRETGNVWKVYFYAESTYTTKVGTMTSTGTVGTEALTKRLTNGTDVALTFSKANAHSAHPTVGENLRSINIDIKTPRLGDKHEMTITNDEVGKYATKLAKLREGLQLPQGPAAPGSAATAALAGAGAGNVDNGNHSWKFTFVSPYGESEGAAASNVLNVTDKTVNGQVSLTGVVAGPAGTTSRKIYRRIAGDTGDWKFVGTIADNSTTTFTDNIADASLGEVVPIQYVETNADSISMS